MTILTSAAYPPGGASWTFDQTYVDLARPATRDFYCNNISLNLQAWTGAGSLHVAVGSVVGTTYTPRYRVLVPKPAGTFPAVFYFKAPAAFVGFKVLAGEYVAAYGNSNGISWSNWATTYLDRTNGERAGGHIFDASFTFTAYPPGHAFAKGIAVYLTEEDGVGRAGHVSQQQPVFEPAGNSFELDVVDSVPIRAGAEECVGGCKPIRAKPRLVRIKR